MKIPSVIHPGMPVISCYFRRANGKWAFRELRSFVGDEIKVVDREAGHSAQALCKRRLAGTGAPDDVDATRRSNPCQRGHWIQCVVGQSKDSLLAR